jgi:hypothetical protein
MVKITPFLQTVKGMRMGYQSVPYGGGNFLHDNYIKGLPEICNMRKPIPSKKFCSILVNNGVSAGISTDVMIIRGVAAIALVQALESINYRVSVKVCYAVQRRNTLQCVINLKAFDQSLEIDRLSFFLADPSSFRRLCFSHMETRDNPIRDEMIHNSYGTPIEIDKSLIGPKDIYFPKSHLHEPQWSSVEGTVEYLRILLKKYGVIA